MTATRKYLAVACIMTTICCTMGVSVNVTSPTILIRHHTGFHGEIISVPILIENATNLMTATINVSFNPLLLQIISVNESAFDTMIPIVNNTEGWVRIGAFQIMGSPLSNRVVIANIDVALIGTPTGYSPIDFTDVYLENESGGDVSCNYINGSFTILEDVCPCKKGDCDQDCNIDVFDLDILGQAWGTFEGDSRFVRCHDFNDDLTVNVFDLDLFAQVWGIMYCDCLPCVAPPWAPW